MIEYESRVVANDVYDVVGRVARFLPVLKTYSHDTVGQRIVTLYVPDGMSTRFLWTRVSGDDDFDWIRERMNELELLDERMCRVGCMRGGTAGVWRMSLSRATYTFSIMHDRGVLSCGSRLIETCDVSQLYERAVELIKRESSIDDVMEFPRELREEMVRVCQE